MTEPYEWRYSPVVKSGYLRIKEAPITNTIQLRPGVLLDKAEDGSVVGIEILNV